MNSPRQPRYNLPLSVRKGVIPLQQRPQVPAQIPVKISRPVLKSARTTPLKAQQKIVGPARTFEIHGLPNAREITTNVITRPQDRTVGIGILTVDRPKSLRRLFDSIKNYTDLAITDIVVSDDGSTNETQLRLLAEISNAGITVLRNANRSGVAANSNKLLRHLDKHYWKLLLNDDVEILRQDWNTWYFDAMEKTHMHHFCYRQIGVYGAQAGETVTCNNILLQVVNDKPHGAVLALDRHTIDKIGYFDEKFGEYGIEHVDWSTRVFESGLQEPGFFDVSGSQNFFKIHPDESAVVDRIVKLQAAREKL